MTISNENKDNGYESNTIPNELTKSNEYMDEGWKDIPPINVQKSMLKIRFKFIILITGITLSCLLLIFLIIPGIFETIYFANSKDYNRILANVTQFKWPVSYVGNIGDSKLYEYKVGAITTAYISNDTGITLQNIVESKVKIPSMKLEYDDMIGSLFYIDAPSNNMNQIYEILSNNPHNVALMNISLEDSMSLTEITQLLLQYQVAISWFAVETGMEYEHNTNISMNGQYRQFGFPTKTIIPNLYKEMVMDYNNPDEYIEYIREEMKWCIEHKNLLYTQSDLIFKEMEQVLEGEISIYGVTIIGTTDELMKLCDEDAIQYAKITGFYPWNIIGRYSH